MNTNSKQEQERIQKNRERFHQWLLNMKNIHTANNSKMTKAFAKIQ